MQCLGIFGAAAEAHRPSYQQYQQIAAKCNQEKKWSLRAAKGCTLIWINTARSP